MLKRFILYLILTAYFLINMIYHIVFVQNIFIFMFFAIFDAMFLIANIGEVIRTIKNI